MVNIICNIQITEKKHILSIENKTLYGLLNQQQL